MGLAVENGTRLHVSLGKASITSPAAPSALVGLTSLERIAQMSSVSDAPPVVTSGDGTLAILSQDTLRASYRIANAPELYDPDRGRLAGATPFAYTSAALVVSHDENVSANVLIGSFGVEAALLSDSEDPKNPFTLAASESLAAQSVFYATAKEPLIGEELFALPAYLQAGASHYASLKVQDILRWILILLMLGGAFLNLIGVIR